MCLIYYLRMKYICYMDHTMIIVAYMCVRRERERETGRLCVDKRMRKYRSSGQSYNSTYQQFQIVIEISDSFRGEACPRSEATSNHDNTSLI